MGSGMVDNSKNQICCLIIVIHTLGRFHANELQTPGSQYSGRHFQQQTCTMGCGMVDDSMDARHLVDTSSRLAQWVVEWQTIPTGRHFQQQTCTMVDDSWKTLLVVDLHNGLWNGRQFYGWQTSGRHQQQTCTMGSGMVDNSYWQTLLVVDLHNGRRFLKIKKDGIRLCCQIIVITPCAMVDWQTPGRKFHAGRSLVANEWQSSGRHFQWQTCTMGSGMVDDS